MTTNSLPVDSTPQMLSLPVIPIAPYLTGHNDHGQLPTSAALHAACKVFGFFYLDLTGFVTPEEMDEVGRLTHEFFALPSEEKNKVHLKLQDKARGALELRNTNLAHSMLSMTVTQFVWVGYQRLKENFTSGKADNQEALDFYKPVSDPDKTKPLWGENQWPTVPGFREKYESWIGKMKELGFIIMEA